MASMRRHYVSRRERLERARRARRRALVVGIVAVLSALAMAPPLRGRIANVGKKGLEAVQAFARGGQTAQAELTLPGREVYALQVGAFDSGESAAKEQSRLAKAGVPCVIWQREQMRLICCAATSREGLSGGSAKGQAAYVVSDVWPQVQLRLTAGQEDVEEALALLMLPDGLFERLQSGEALDALMVETREQAKRAMAAHPESALYSELAQSLANWCDLMEETRRTQSEETARAYAQATMCTLCRELRVALQQSAGSITGEAA